MVPAFNGRHYPIEYLDPREFELLNYFLFKKNIESGIHKGKFDTVLLMKGMSDRGRDLLLQYGSKNRGIVQCKRYESLLTRPALAREVIKFALHAIQDKSLIADRSQFTYYFVVLKGFNETATKFLGNFNNESVNELDLKPWTEEVINENTSLNNLNYDDIAGQLKEILSSIKMEPITSADLDLQLKENRDVVSIFFEVEKVASESMIREVLEEFTGFKNDEDMEKLRQKLKDIPKDKRLNGGLFKLYGYDEGFYRKILNEEKLITKIVELKSTLHENFIDYLAETIGKFILVYITGMGNISPFTKSLMQGYLFNKYAVKYNLAEIGTLFSGLNHDSRKDSLVYKYQTLEEHKNYALEVGQMVLNEDFSSFYGEGKLLELKKNVARFTYGGFSSTDEMQKRYESDMVLLRPTLDVVEEEISKIMPSNPTLILGSGGIAENENDLVDLFNRLKKFQ